MRRDDPRNARLPPRFTRRRALLGTLAAPALATATATATAPTATATATATAQDATLATPLPPPLPAPAVLSAADARRFVALRARLDGQPVFAIARGTDAALVAGRSLPLRGNLILQATRAIDAGDGSWQLPYVETTLTVSAASFEFLPTWENPLTGARQDVPRPTVSLARLQMAAGGALANQLRLSNGTAIDYSGEVALQAGPEGTDWATQSLHIHVTRPNGAVEDAWVTTTMMQAGKSRRGFLPADSISSSTRPRLPAALAGGRDGLLVSSYYGRKHQTLESLRRTLSPAQRTLLEPFFDQWRTLLP